MHLEEMFRLIEENRRRFVAKRVERVRLARSAAWASPCGEDACDEKCANDPIEAVPMEVGAGARTDAEH